MWISFRIYHILKHNQLWVKLVRVISALPPYLTKESAKAELLPPITCPSELCFLASTMIPHHWRCYSWNTFPNLDLAVGVWNLFYILWWLNLSRRHNSLLNPCTSSQQPSDYTEMTCKDTNHLIWSQTWNCTKFSICEIAAPLQPHHGFLSLGEFTPVMRFLRIPVFFKAPSQWCS